MKKLEKKSFYIYNLEQAEFFIKNKLIPVKIEVHRRTKKVFFKFVRDEGLEDVLALWQERLKE